MRSHVRRPIGPARRVLATALLVAMPLAVSACSGEGEGEGVGTEGGVEELEEEDD